MNEAESAQNSQPFVDKDAARSGSASLQTLRNQFAAFQTALDAPLADVVANRAPFSRTRTDTSRMPPLSWHVPRLFDATGGWGFAYDFRRRTYLAILASVRNSSTAGTQSWLISPRTPRPRPRPTPTKEIPPPGGSRTVHLHHRPHRSPPPPPRISGSSPSSSSRPSTPSGPVCRD